MSLYMSLYIHVTKKNNRSTMISILCIFTIFSSKFPCGQCQCFSIFSMELLNTDVNTDL